MVINYSSFNTTIKCFDSIQSSLFKLRQLAWTEYGNKAKDVHLLYDNLDNSAVHWVVQSGNTTLAAARLNIIKTKETSSDRLNLLIKTIEKQGIYLPYPLAYFSRLVVHPDFRRRGISHRLYEARFEYLSDQRVQFTFLCTLRKTLKENLLKGGWNEIATIPAELLPGAQSHIMIHYKTTL